MIKNAPLVDFDENELAKLTGPEAKPELVPIPENWKPRGLRPSRDNPMLLAMAAQNQARRGKKAPAGRQPKPAETPTWPAENRHKILLRYLAGRGPAGATMSGILGHLRIHTPKGSYNSKTVRRDIAQLIKNEDYLINFDRKRQVWVFENPPSNFSLARIRLSRKEMTALRLATAPFAAGGHPFEMAMRSVLLRFADTLDDDQKLELKDFAKLMNVKITPVIDLDIGAIDLIETAIHEKREVTMKYRSLGEGRPHLRRVQPHGLYFRNGGCYMAAYNPQSKGMRSYLISRAKEWRLTQKIFKEQREFRMEDFLAGSFGAMSGTGPAQTVRVRLYGMAARLADERIWHSTQDIKSKSRRKDGSLEVTFNLRGLDEVRRWILQWEGEAEVVEPELLNEQIKKAGKKILART